MTFLERSVREEWAFQAQGKKVRSDGFNGTGRPIGQRQQAGHWRRRQTEKMPAMMPL